MVVLFAYSVAWGGELKFLVFGIFRWDSGYIGA